MSKLEELVQELCPDGVEYKPLEELCNITTGKLNANAKHENGLYPFFTCDAEPFKINEYAFDTTAIIVAGNGNGHVNFYSGKFNAYQRTYVLDSFKNVEVGFLLHYLMAYLKPYFIKNSKKGSVPYITLPMLEDFKVPLPPLEVQKEIVRILDSFTELTTELTTELIKRKQQYEYYRDKLLTFNEETDNIVCTELGTIGKVCMCKRIMKAETSSQGDVPFFKIGTFGGEANAFISRETFEKYKELYSYPKKGDILISAAGTIGRTVIFDGEPAYFQDSNIVWVDNDESVVLNKYLYYYYQLQPWKASTGGTLLRLYNDNIAKAKILFPPIEEQKRIITILDTFNDLCNDLSNGLPAEINARQKQYEYYRDKLLTFKKLA